MLKQLQKTAVCLIAGLAIAAPAYGAADTKASYNAESSTALIQTYLNEAYGHAVTVIASENPDAHISESGTVADAVYTGEGGFVRAEIKMPEQLPGGKYYVYLISENDSANAYFMHVNKAEVQSLLPKLNGAQSPEEMLSLFKENAGALAIDMESVSGCLAKTAEVFYGIKQEKAPYKDVYALIKDIRISEVSALLKSGADAKKVLFEYQSSLNIDYDSYLNLNENARALLNKCLADADFTKYNDGVLYNELFIYSQVKTAESRRTLKSVCEKYADEINADKTYYNKTVNKDEVYGEMFGRLGELDGFDGIADLFYKCSETVYKKENGNTSPGGGTGGTGGGGGGGASSGVGGMKVDTDIARQLNGGNGLNDISGHWAESCINSLCESGIVNGFPDKTFRPENGVSRSEFAKMIYTAFDIPEGEGVRFNDVSEGDWFYTCCTSMAAAGIINGDGEGAFNPGDGITRQDAAVIIYRALKTKGVEFESSSIGFSDGAQISDYASEAAAALCGAGIINGDNGAFRPFSGATRAEAAAIIYRALHSKEYVK